MTVHNLATPKVGEYSSPPNFAPNSMRGHKPYGLPPQLFGRHMNFFQYRCELVAKVPRTWCRTDGVHQVPVPWAREGSGFTLMMEGLVMLLSAEMPVEAMADFLDERDTRLWRVLMHYVEQAHAKSDWSAVRRIAVDDDARGRGSGV
jgi:transposase